MIVSLLVVMLLLSATQPQGIGVRPGDWARYEKRFYEKLTNNNHNGDNITYADTRIIELKIIDVNGTELTYMQTLLRGNGSLMWQATYTVDPTKQINSTYTDPLILEGELQLLLAPSGLKVGDHLPETIWLHNTDYTGYVSHEWFQRVNSTTIEGDPLNPITVNHVEWSVDTHSVAENGQDCSFLE
jgi:hypothetical protein